MAWWTRQMLPNQPQVPAGPQNGWMQNDQGDFNLQSNPLSAPPSAPQNQTMPFIFNGTTPTPTSPQGPLPATPLGGIGNPSQYAAEYRQFVPVPMNIQEEPSLMNPNIFRAGGGFGVHNPNYAGAMGAYNNAMAQWGQGMGQYVNAAGNYNQGLMQNNQAQGRLGHDMMQLLGANGVPGTLATGGANAWAQIQNALNGRGAVDVQRDQFVLQEYQRRRARGLDHEVALREMEQAGYPRSRVLNAIGGGGGTLPLPPGFGGGNGQPSFQPSGVQPPPQTTPFRPGIDPPRPGGPVNNSPIANQQQPAAQTVIDQAFANARQLIPTTPGAAVPGQINPPETRTPYANAQDAYHRAITSVFENMDDATLRANWPAIQQRLRGDELGGPQALDDWYRGGTNWPNPFVPNARQRAISRLHGISRDPLTGQSVPVPASAPNRFIWNLLQGGVPGIAGAGQTPNWQSLNPLNWGQ